MRIPTTTFLCDQARCSAKETVHEKFDQQTAAYLELVDRGWRTERSLIDGWKNYCPEHDTAAKRKAADDQIEADRRAERERQRQRAAESIRHPNAP